MRLWCLIVKCVCILYVLFKREQHLRNLVKNLYHCFCNNSFWYCCTVVGKLYRYFQVINLTLMEYDIGW
ncbi:unnamed protein product [Acanthoscelides obtectus]|uniref:Uncharacterized protein n=1 Tax=Acanthoscelides obtectus TaxID=200917 RepID=A0A9P0L1N2_ACAOB|nr:unnamed protein product [Acanthoscelides obtectus]CAK1656738.1 hypothetical protein AOBTE_LOCUS19890 [Acanthoscelides obtectus]